MLINFKPQTALLVILCHSTEVRIGGGVGGWALFELGVAGVNFCGVVVFAEIQFGDFM